MTKIIKPIISQEDNTYCHRLFKEGMPFLHKRSLLTLLTDGEANHSQISVRITDHRCKSQSTLRVINRKQLPNLKKWQCVTEYKDTGGQKIVKLTNPKGIYTALLMKPIDKYTDVELEKINSKLVNEESLGHIFVRAIHQVSDKPSLCEIGMMLQVISDVTKAVLTPENFASITNEEFNKKFNEQLIQSHMGHFATMAISLLKDHEYCKIIADLMTKGGNKTDADTLYRKKYPERFNNQKNDNPSAISSASHQ